MGHHAARAMKRCEFEGVQEKDIMGMRWHLTWKTTDEGGSKPKPYFFGGISSNEFVQGQCGSSHCVQISEESRLCSRCNDGL